MKKINVELKGVCPLLHHRFATEDFGANVSKQKKKVYIPEEEAEKYTYRGKDGKLYQPSEHILGVLIKAGVKFKYEGKKTFKDALKAGIIVEPENIPLLNDKEEQFDKWDEIDTRNVVVQRARIIRWRPKFNEWKLKFSLTILNDDEVAPNDLKYILEYSGRLGIGVYRPRFGRFQVVSFQEVDC